MTTSERRMPLVCPVLVGRDDLLELADRRLHEVGEGHGRLLLVAGEAGLGKTRLVGAIERRAVAAAYRGVRAGTYPSDLQVPAAIFIELSRTMQRTDATRDLGRRLADRLEDRDPATGDANRRRRLLVLDIAELVAELAADGPAILVLEDLHWSDDLTLDVLEALARRIDDLPLLVVATYRSDELFPRVPMRDWRARLLAQRRAEEIRLARLTAADTAQMTRLLVGPDLPLARDVAEAIHLRTDGIPLHVEELLAVLAESGLEDVDHVRGADVPGTVEDAITTRIDACSSAARQVARAGAVIGRAFDLELLSAVMDLPPEQLSEPLEELAEQFVLLPARTPGRYGFRHALICDAIYERIPVPERRRLHGRSADAASGDEVGTDAFLALHFERAGRRPEAFAAAVRGARAASAISAHAEARELHACAVRTMPVDLPPVDRGRLFEGLAASAAATDDNEAADVAFREARAAYLAAGDTLAAAAIVGPHVAVRHLLGDGLAVRADALRSALGEIVAPPALHGVSVDPASDRVRGKLLAGLAAAYMLDRRLDEGIAYATDARAIASIAEDEATAQDAAATRGACLVFAGRMDDGWQMLEGAIATSLARHLEAEASRSYRMIATSASVLVEYPRAERWLREGIDYAERVQLWNHRHYMTAHLGHVLWATGRWAEAAELARGALADGRGGITTRITALHVLGYVALVRGDLDAAIDLLEEARGLGQRMNELQRLSPALWGLAEAARLRGDFSTTVQRSEEAVAASERVGDAAYAYPFLVTGCRAFLELGDPLAAEGWVARVAARITERAIPGTLPAIDHGTGLVLLAKGSTGRARQALERAIAGWRDRTRVWEGTWASIDLARCLVRSNAKAEAARLAAAARDEATRLGSPPLAAAAEGVLTTTGRRGQAPDAWAPLTAREFEVARLVMDGRTNPEIAAELTVAPKTVAAHVEHILAKLGVGRRAEIAAWAAARGVVHSRPHDGDREK